MQTAYLWTGHWSYSTEKYHNLGQVFKNLRTKQAYLGAGILLVSGSGFFALADISHM